MALQVFVQNPEAGEPWAYCGPAKGDWQDMVKAIGHYGQAEVENAAMNGEKELTLAFKLVEMSEEEVAALEEI